MTKLPQDKTPSRSISLSVVLVVATIAAGLAVRFAGLGLSPIIVKYGGSMLWALMLYWIVSTLCFSWRLSSVAMSAGALATAIEFFKLVRGPWLDAFRHTLPCVLLLGRFFSLWDIAAYWLAIAAGVFVDWAIRWRLRSSTSRSDF